MPNNYAVNIMQGVFAGEANHFALVVRISEPLSPSQHTELMRAIETISDIVTPLVQDKKPLIQLEFEKELNRVEIGVGDTEKALFNANRSDRGRSARDS